MDTCYKNYRTSIVTSVSTGVLFIGLLAGQACINPSQAATTSEPTFNNTTQLAYWWRPWPYQRGYYYPRDNYQRHYWSGWYGNGYGNACQQRCLHNRWTGAVVRCERICR